MKLSEFIRGHHREILQEWETFAGTMTPAAEGMSRSALRDHAEEILNAIAEDLESPQASAEQSRKSKGRGEEHRMQAVGKVHAALRLERGFKLSQLVAEYRALRASVLRLYDWEAHHEAAREVLLQVTRFNESIDEALIEATNRYTSMMDRTRDHFLAILGHDLRNPLGAILMSAALMSRAHGQEDKEAKTASRILTSAQRMTRMVNDLLDLTRTRLGSGIPIAPVPMDLEALCREVVSEIEAFHPDRRLHFHSEGDLAGRWDPDRLAQVLSNLVGNALQHGDPTTPVEIAAGVDGEEVVIDVHNQGRPIPRAQLANIFEPMVRRVAAGSVETSSTSLGLGLYIAREIVISHGGTVRVSSSGKDGTTFSVRLPRHSATSRPPVATEGHADEHDATGQLVALSDEHARAGSH